MIQEPLQKRSRKLIKVLFLPALLAAGTLGYQALISVVDRGDLIGNQLGDGGRVTNFFEALDMLYSADLGELLWGRGLGVGTNTAYGLLSAQRITPESYRFNLLIDNSLLTTFFQFGFVGSALFWLGICMFVLSIRPRMSARFRRRYWVTIADRKSVV